MALNDVYRLLVEQNLLGSNVLNVFWYKAIGLGTDPVPSDALIEAFAGNVWGDVVAIQNDQVNTTLYEALNFNDLTDFGSLTSNATGSRTGQTLPVFNTWTFQLQRSVLTLRNGRKAIAGVSETDQENGQPSAGITALLDTAADAMSDDITATDTSIWRPVIVRRPTTSLPLIPTSITMLGAQFKRISTQSSRKS